MRDFRSTWEQNWPYMLIAFALAVVFWLTTSAEAPTQQEVPTRLIVQNLDARYVLTSRLPEEVDVKFRGPGRDLLQLLFTRPRLVHTVERVRSRVQEVELDRSMVTVPEGVDATPLDVLRGPLVLKFEPALARTVRVAPRVEAILPAEGYAVAGPPRVDPPRVKIRGARSSVRSIDTLWTVPVRWERLRDTAVRVVELDLPDVEGPLELDTAVVRVEVPVEPAAEVVLEEIPVRLIGAAANGLAARPGSVRVRLRGPESALSRITSKDVDARVRVEGGEPRGGGWPVEVRVANPYIEAVTSDSVRVIPRG